MVDARTTRQDRATGNSSRLVTLGHFLYGVGLALLVLAAPLLWQVTPKLVGDPDPTATEMVLTGPTRVEKLGFATERPVHAGPGEEVVCTTGLGIGLDQPRFRKGFHKHWGTDGPTDQQGRRLEGVLEIEARDSSTPRNWKETVEVRCSRYPVALGYASRAPRDRADLPADLYPGGVALLLGGLLTVTGLIALGDPDDTLRLRTEARRMRWFGWLGGLLLAGATVLLLATPAISAWADPGTALFRALPVLFPAGVAAWPLGAALLAGGVTMPRP